MHNWSRVARLDFGYVLGGRLVGFSRHQATIRRTELGYDVYRAGVGTWSVTIAMTPTTAAAPSSPAAVRFIVPLGGYFALRSRGLWQLR